VKNIWRRFWRHCGVQRCNGPVEYLAVNSLAASKMLTCGPFTEREVKKANRELHSATSRMNDIQKIDHLTKRCSDLLAEMKRHERESIKNKKRGDQLQKDKDNTRNELNKTITLKEKLEKLCRELQKENNKLKVCQPPAPPPPPPFFRYNTQSSADNALDR